MSLEERVFDTGLQAERTALAWRRTSLAMGVGAVGAGRIAAPTLGAVAVVVAVGLAQALVVAGAAQRRYRTVHRSRVAHPDLRAVRAGALPIAALAGSGVVVGALALAFVVAG